MTNDPFETWLKDNIGPARIDERRLDGLIEATMRRLGPQTRRRTLWDRIRDVLNRPAFDLPLRFGVPMAAGLMLGILIGGDGLQAESTALASYLWTPSFTFEGL
ncbi:MAG: hypothetical protein HZA67_01570 [Rhodospirillales bacterium]|jgi:hypothetical protein|nr:hypothetical protein [Rhodospirillales bacterium]